MRKLIAALACRNNGSRLYGKPLQNLDIEKQYSVLDYIIDCLKAEKSVSEIVLGISQGKENLIFTEYAEKHKIKYITGDEKDVLSRLIKCGEVTGASDIFRITTESPFFYYEIIGDVWKNHMEKDYDASFVDGVPDGSGFEIIKLTILKSSHEFANERHWEHCTLYLRENKNRFLLNYYQVNEEFRRTDLRFTIDNPEDLILCRKVYTHFKDHAPLISLNEIIRFVDKHPELNELVSKFVEDGLKTMYL